MTTIPKIVLARLNADANARTHPDADVLTAFAEQGLTARERAGVFEHLARCADCREVVAMALPPVEETAAVLLEDRSSRFVWPLLRWGLATVGVLLIGWFGVRLLQQSHGSATVADFSQPRIRSKRSRRLRRQRLDRTDKADQSRLIPSELVASGPTTEGLAKSAPQADTTSVASNQPHHATTGGAMGSRWQAGQ